MSESAYLIDPISKEYDLRERLVDLDQLYSILGVHNPEVGLDMAEALTKLQRDGPNKVTPPINLPSWMCCLLPCVKAIPKMQEYDKMVPKTARVIRSGRVMIVDAADLVVGDIICLKPDTIVPADCRLIECKSHLQIDRSYFFSEYPVMECYCLLSQPSSATHLFYQSDICFMASRVISGEAKAIVIRTGDRTFWGYTCQYKRRDSFI
ncbi:uncharacterized protein [Blastocystis hominis]|uniref:P-type ATPase A domain-containing protein n=1 Tax=Blastocystis hominis TaxID=12968 RepID=D8M2P7_BLAHO|nr:uncharacterized protein [Blastocystis hominis]CBK22620.2 unnamed protein product [Blastocystis hominis]|eukprot:XP_012896668.1 uncharacterized protein [Blastocystis hominis]